MTSDADNVPSPAQRAGGEDAIERLFVRFFERGSDSGPFIPSSPKVRHGAAACRPRGPLRLLARGVGGGFGAAARRGASPGPADGSHLPAASASAEELIAAIGLEPRHAYSRRHLEPLQDFSRSRIDSPQIALVIFPGAVPELSVDPGDSGDEAAGLDGAKNRPCF